MTGQPTALLVAVATWVGAAAAVYLTCSLLRLRRLAPPVAAAVLALGAAAGGVASADAPHPSPPGASLGWTTAKPVGASRPVVVRPGDCLWAIAARQLLTPTPARVAQRWPAWWHTNRGVIGPDPDLIRPGEHLRRPGTTPRRH